MKTKIRNYLNDKYKKENELIKKMSIANDKLYTEYLNKLTYDDKNKALPTKDNFNLVIKTGEQFEKNVNDTYDKVFDIYKSTIIDIPNIQMDLEFELANKQTNKQTKNKAEVNIDNDILSGIVEEATHKDNKSDQLRFEELAKKTLDKLNELLMKEFK